jgi:hypothetical protein
VLIFRCLALPCHKRNEIFLLPWIYFSAAKAKDAEKSTDEKSCEKGQIN